MNSKPYILVLSNTNTKPKSLIKLITKSSSFTANDDTAKCIQQDWIIDTKYYTANVTLFGLESDIVRSEEFNQNVEGVVIHLDTNSETGLKELKVWDNINNDCEPEVKILIANYCDDKTKVLKNEVLEWCLEHNFEFIELYPQETEVTDFEEKVGVERILEALHSHTWSNLKLKSKSVIKSDDNSTDDDFREEGLDDFAEMFSQLHMMRENLSSLSPNQRKQCAEQMVTAFWNAIGGEEEELLDL